MLVLGINTATDACEAALARGGVVIASLSEPMTRGHDSRLAPLVEQLLREHGVEARQLDRVAVVVGPGSFTGVRVGVSFARALALAVGATVAGVTSLEALGPPPTGRVLGLLPAKRRPPDQSWWAQVVEHGRGVSEPVEANADDIVGLASGVDALWGDIDDAFAVTAIKRQLAQSSAAAAALFASRLPDHELPAAKPIYVREPDAAPMRAPTTRLSP